MTEHTDKERLDKIACSVKELDAILNSNTAASIVRKHNAHDALVAACEYAQGVLEDDVEPQLNKADYLDGAIRGISEALALAKEEPE